MLEDTEQSPATTQICDPQTRNDYINHQDGRTVRRSILERGDLPEAGIQPDVKISAIQRMLAACSGSILTSFLVTPLDVVRVRLQSQLPLAAASSSQSQNLSSITEPLRAHKLPLAPLQFQSTAALSAPELGVTACCREVFWVNTTAAEACIASAPTALNDSCIVEHTARRRFDGTWEGLVKIARYEGVSSLWRGLSPTLLMAVPANVIYFTGYDWLRTSDKSPFSSLGATIAPLIAGSAARAIAATAISPLEMFKTRLQASNVHTHPVGSSYIFHETLQGLRTMMINEGPLTLWRGLGLTLWRDVPFSGLYWYGYEVTKNCLRARRETNWSMVHGHPTGILAPLAYSQQKSDLHIQSTFIDAFIAGAASGSVAAFLTTPFDVGKTRRQIAHSKGDKVRTRAISMPKILMEIWKEGGVNGLWKGCTPRILKVAPACAIMISSYEVGKKTAVKINRKRNDIEHL